MKIFVLCEDMGVYSGRIIGYQLQQRLKNNVTVQKGGPNEFTARINAGEKYDFILNMGRSENIINYSRPLNHFLTTKCMINRKSALLKMKIKKLSIPHMLSKPEVIADSDLPMIGRARYSKDKKDMWKCFSLSDVVTAHIEGATHFVERIENPREFKVHVVATTTNIQTIREEDYRVIKISERLHKSGTNIYKPCIKTEFTNWYFSAPKNPEEPLIKKVEALGRKALYELHLHWGAVTILVGKSVYGLEKAPQIIKIDTCPSLKEDQANTLSKYSYALCKMLGQKPQTLKISRPKNCGQL